MTGRQRRRQHEWLKLQQLMEEHGEMRLTVTAHDADGVPTAYEVHYNLRSICGINEDQSPRFATGFTLRLVLPEDYPQADAPPQWCFVGEVLPWHPNIRYYGPMAGRVCVNPLNTFVDLAWGVERIGLYLRYDLYHALHESPYPEDLKVAAWVRHYGEPNEWIFFSQETTNE